MNAQSVLDRLRTVAKRDGREFQATLLLYAQERLLARLAGSAYREHFALKGGVYLYSRYRATARPTQDMDFAGRNTSNDPQALLGIVRDIAGVSLHDGVTYNLETLTAAPIAEATEYAGVRVRLEARIGQARLRVTLDIGFGDAITPAPHLQTFPTLLTTEAITVLTVTLETVIAEKFQAMVALGAQNTRLKDFYDLHRIALTEPLSATALRIALERTFERRETSFTTALECLAQDFAADSSRQRLWEAYLKRTRLEAPGSFADVMSAIQDLLEPIVSGAAEGEWRPQLRRWN